MLFDNSMVNTHTHARARAKTLTKNYTKHTSQVSAAIWTTTEDIFVNDVATEDAEDTLYILCEGY